MWFKLKSAIMVGTFFLVSFANAEEPSLACLGPVEPTVLTSLKGSVWKLLRSTGEFAKSDKSIKLRFDSSLIPSNVPSLLLELEPSEDSLNMHREISGNQSTVTETFSCWSASPRKFSCTDKERGNELEFSVSFYSMDERMHMILREPAGESVYLRLVNE